MKFTISKREARLGTNATFRTQFHGDEPVTGSDVHISGVMLSQEELNALLQEPLASRALFVRRPGSLLDDPLLRGVHPLKLIDKIEAASVTIFVGLEQTPIDLGTCKLKGVTLQPCTAGLTELSCMVQATPTLDRRIGTLLEHMDAGIQVEIGYEHNAQQPQLPMGAAFVAKPGETKPADGNGDFEKAATEQVAAFKRGRKAKSAAKDDRRPDAH